RRREGEVGQHGSDAADAQHGADRDANFRACDPRVAHGAVHEDRVACAGGALTMRKIKKGDYVIVIAGRDKGKRGDVTRTVGADYVLVAGVNQVKKHARPNPMKNQPGGIVTKE